MPVSFSTTGSNNPDGVTDILTISTDGMTLDDIKGYDHVRIPDGVDILLESPLKVDMVIECRGTIVLREPKK